MFNDTNAFVITLILVLGVSSFIWSDAISNNGQVILLATSLPGDPPGGGPPLSCGNVDAVAVAAGKDGCAITTICAEKSCCDYELVAGTNTPTGKCVCEVVVNPCGTDNEKCLACMAYSEAGGDTINDDCMKFAMCAVKNRVGKKEFGSPKNECEAIAKGNGKQFDSFSCVCDNQNKNQKYCKCCAGTITDPAEKQEVEDAKKIAKDLDCSGFKANSFNNAGMDSWAKKNCTQVKSPDSCPTFDFFICPKQ